jgi:hypothetical protein
LGDKSDVVFYLDEPPERRRLLAAISATRKDDSYPSAAQILAARLELGGKAGEGEIAKHLHTSESTVYRRRRAAGLIPWPDEDRTTEPWVNYYR